MLFREIIAVFSDNYKKAINTLADKSSEVFIQVLRCSCHWCNANAASASAAMHLGVWLAGMLMHLESVSPQSSS
jgi:hypothetical protein